MVKASTFGGGFVAVKTAIKQVEGLHCELRMMGIPIDGPTNVFKSVFKSATRSKATLKKKHNTIACDRTREAVAAGIVCIAWVNGRFNLADVFTGMWRREWIPLQQEHYKYKRSCRSAKIWLSRIIRHNMETLWQLWERRNAKVHDTGQIKTHLQVVREIRYLFDQPRSEWPSAVHYLFKDQHKLLQGSLPQLQQWIQAAETHRNTDPRLLDCPFTGAHLLCSIQNQPTLNPTRSRATTQ